MTYRSPICCGWLRTPSFRSMQSRVYGTIVGVTFVSPLACVDDPPAESRAVAAVQIKGLSESFQAMRPHSRNWTSIRIGAGNGRLAELERGRRKIMMRFAWRLCLEYNVPLSAVLTLDSSQPAPSPWLASNEHQLVSVNILTRLCGYAICGQRTARDMYQLELARLIGCDRPQISIIERAKEDRSALFVGQICAALDVTLVDLALDIESRLAIWLGSQVVTRR